MPLGPDAAGGGTGDWNLQTEKAGSWELENLPLVLSSSLLPGLVPKSQVTRIGSYKPQSKVGRGQEGHMGASRIRFFLPLWEVPTPPTPHPQADKRHVSDSLFSVWIKNGIRLGRRREFQMSVFLWPATSCRRQSRGAARTVADLCPGKGLLCTEAIPTSRTLPSPSMSQRRTPASNRQVSARAASPRVQTLLAWRRGPSPWGEPACSGRPVQDTLFRTMMANVPPEGPGSTQGRLPGSSQRKQQ